MTLSRRAAAEPAVAAVVEALLGLVQIGASWAEAGAGTARAAQAVDDGGELRARAADADPSVELSVRRAPRLSARGPLDQPARARSSFAKLPRRGPPHRVRPGADPARPSRRRLGKAEAAVERLLTPGDVSHRPRRQRRDPDERRGHPAGERRPPRPARPLRDDRRPNPLQQGRSGEHRPRRRLRVPGRARLRRGHRRCPGHRRLRRAVGQLRRGRAARRLRGRRMGGRPALVRRARSGLSGPSYMGLNQLQTAAQPPAAPEGDLPDRADGRQLSRHHLLRRGAERVVHPPVAGAGDRGQRDARTPRADDPARRAWRRCSTMSPARSTSSCRRSSAAPPAATSPTTAPSGRRAPRSRWSTGSTSRRSSSAACTTSSNVASR